MTKIQVGYSAPEQGVGSDGFLISNRLVTEVFATDRKPRMPSDGSCGCRRERRDEQNVLVLCAKHAAEPGIVKFCLSDAVQQW